MKRATAAVGGALARAALALALASCLVSRCAAADSTQHAGAEPPDSAPVASPAAGAATTAAVPDTIAASAAVPDTVPPTQPVLPDSARAGLPSRVDFDAQRKRGEVSFDAALLGRRVALYSPLPLYGAPEGALTVPDAGSPIRPDRPGIVGDAATDRTLYDTGSYGLGVPDLAIGLDDPRGDSVEPFDMTALSGSLAPGPLSRPGQLLAEPKGVWTATGALPDGAPKMKRAKSALYYGNGNGGEKEVGARFVMPQLGDGIVASYVRHEAGGTGPLNHALTKRWTGAIGLPGFLSHTFWLEGKSIERTIEDDVIRVSGVTSEVSTQLGSAQAKAGDVSLHGRAAGEGWESSWLVRGGLAKRSQVAPDSARTQWRFPEWGAEWSASKQTAPGWTASIRASGSMKQVQYEVGAYSIVDERRDAARVEVGVRREIDAGSGISLDLAPDFRETDPPLLDARISYWRTGARASARIDLESAHERPSWVDLMTPSAVIVAPIPNTTSAMVESVSGDPALPARRLDGALAVASYQASRALSLSATGSLRHVEGDFGWNLAEVQTADTLYLSDQAGPRGSGWVSHGSLDALFHVGFVTVRAMAWTRGGPEGLTPVAGTPPRYGGDGAADFRALLFGKDVAFTLGLRAHAWGPRSGLIDVPGGATWDLALRGDFGAAAAFIEIMNVFDRKVASSMLGLYGDGTVVMPSSAFHFGFTWYLMD